MKPFILAALLGLTALSPAQAGTFCSNGSYFSLLNRMGSGTINLNYSVTSTRIDSPEGHIEIVAGNEIFTSGGKATVATDDAGCFTYTTTTVTGSDYDSHTAITLTIKSIGGHPNTRCAGGSLVESALLTIGGTGPLAGTHPLTCGP